jgi:hypothetical protein
MGMADENSRDTLKTALSDFDIPHLHKIMVAAYDRWCWDSGSTADKDWFQVAEELLKEQGVTSNMTALKEGGNRSLRFTNVDEMTMSACYLNDPCQEQVLFKIGDATGRLELGYDLQQAIVRAIGDEVTYDATPTNQGCSLRYLIQSIIRETIRDGMA